MNTTESPRDRRNRLARESYARRRLLLTTEQLDHRRAQQRDAYRLRTETESGEQVEHRHETRYAAYVQHIQQRCASNAAPLHWIEERVTSSVSTSVFSTCCANRKRIAYLMIFEKIFVIYNSILAFTSMGAKIDQSVVGTQGVYAFQIHGEMYHQIGSLLSNYNETSAFLQIYIYNTEEQLFYRQCLILDLNLAVFEQLQEMLHNVNLYVHYAPPSVSKSAVLVVGNGQETEPANRDIIHYKQDGWYPYIFL
ncbi:13013_t:CDS:2 [Cetraspora pellucida]|uniref:13013_t:CDS:1 n=1 Tax=Cetraspora pellucida TaxID=1433469 RepID=A0A9N9I2Q4_9GLOM|nr:13013_t:CDS:2 [Cetraspora pellucida]